MEVTIEETKAKEEKPAAAAKKTANYEMVEVLRADGSIRKMPRRVKSATATKERPAPKPKPKPKPKAVDDDEITAEIRPPEKPAGATAGKFLGAVAVGLTVGALLAFIKPRVLESSPEVEPEAPALH